MAKKLYVGNLSYSTDEGSLEESFSEFGTVESVAIIKDRDTGRSKGFGFVEMSDDEAAKKAISALNESEFDKRVIAVTEARPREEKTYSNNRQGCFGGGTKRY